MFVRALERKKTEEDLRESREMLRTLSDQSLMGIIVLQDELFVYVNGQAAKIMEVSSGGDCSLVYQAVRRVDPPG